jgi:hypothetical protein
MKPALFFVVDLIPEYVKETFNLDTYGRSKDTSFTGYNVIFEGESIPDLQTALVIYNDHPVHRAHAHQLVEQIKALNYGASVMLIPIKG